MTARNVSEQTMVERVARAIAEANSGPWELMSPEGQTAALYEARAAIEAMREPTPEQARAAVEAIHVFATANERGFEAFHGVWGDKAMRVYMQRLTIGYRAMIDAALAEKQP